MFIIVVVGLFVWGRGADIEGLVSVCWIFVNNLFVLEVVCCINLCWILVGMVLRNLVLIKLRLLVVFGVCLCVWVISLFVFKNLFRKFFVIMESLFVFMFSVVVFWCCCVVCFLGDLFMIFVRFLLMFFLFCLLEINDDVASFAVFKWDKKVLEVVKDLLIFMYIVFD